MTGMRRCLVFLILCLMPFTALANDRLVHVYAPEAIIETGLLKFILPRFSLKTQVRVELVDSPSQADIVLGEAGQALFFGLGQTWQMAQRRTDHLGTTRLADWLVSDVGQRTVTSFAPDGAALFGPPRETERPVVAVQANGNAELGRRVSQTKCIRCHRVDNERRMSGIGSTPSFAVLRSLSDWEARFSTFYVLNPHPSFTVVEGVTLPFAIDRPSPIVPVILTLDEVEAVLAYVALMKAADLGAPLAHQ